MTDNEIIKALRCLAGEEMLCKDCAFIKLEGRGFACKKNVSTAAIDLINHQKAEIERLTINMNVYGLAAKRLAEEKSEWISVDERLPDKQCEVLAYYGFIQEEDSHTLTDLGYMAMGVLTYFANDLNPHWQHESVGLRVTHWMPLPEPPKGEE